MSERTVHRVGAKVVVRSIDNAGCTMRALTVKSKLRLPGSALAATLARPDVQSTLADVSWRTGGGHVTVVSVVYGKPEPQLVSVPEAATGVVAEAEMVWQGSDRALDQDLEELRPEEPQRTLLDWKNLGKVRPGRRRPARDAVARGSGNAETPGPGVQRARLSAPAAPGGHRRAHLRAPRRGPQLHEDRQKPSASRRGPSRPMSAASRREAGDEPHSVPLMRLAWRTAVHPGRTRRTSTVAAQRGSSHHIDGGPTPPSAGTSFTVVVNTPPPRDPNAPHHELDDDEPRVSPSNTSPPRQPQAPQPPHPPFREAIHTCSLHIPNCRPRPPCRAPYSSTPVVTLTKFHPSATPPHHLPRTLHARTAPQPASIPP